MRPSVLQPTWTTRLDVVVYCLSLIDVTGPTHGVGSLVGLGVTVDVHLWRRNTGLSIVAGTTACLIVTNWI